MNQTQRLPTEKKPQKNVQHGSFISKIMEYLKLNTSINHIMISDNECNT